MRIHAHTHKPSRHVLKHVHMRKFYTRTRTRTRMRAYACTHSREKTHAKEGRRARGTLLRPRKHTRKATTQTQYSHDSIHRYPRARPRPARPLRRTNDIPAPPHDCVQFQSVVAREPPLRPRAAQARRGDRSVRRQSQHRHTPTNTTTQATAHTHTRTSMRAPSRPLRRCWIRRVARRRARGANDQGAAPGPHNSKSIAPGLGV